ncbi:MAG: dipeptidyl peptidase 3 [Bacteroidia bacterium]|nr:dipeptidyl peptidase 3 [Bacteroidia bacterium]MCF8426767.1 dipeptidyl peptidase 3 [Bacteroidia bacterium]MCF8445559.1 dipeptidyl peptidase 3 [Bacteroidia bacterium]
MMYGAIGAALTFTACSNDNKTAKSDATESNFEVNCDEFADLQVLRFEIPGFAELTPKQKELAYYLYEAANCGRDIFYDQKYKHNLRIRRTLEAVLNQYSGDKTTEDWKNFETYAKRVFFSNGIHHHYSNIKFVPACGFEYFQTLVKACDPATLPLDGATVDAYLTEMKPIIFDPKVDAKLVNLASGIDNVVGSANNFYEGVSQNEVEAYYNSRMDSNDTQPISWGLNSKMVKENGVVTEKVYKVGGMYTGAIEKIVFWLEKAVTVAENDKQKKALELLIEYYKTGDLKKWDEYNIAWVNDTESRLDVVNGFIEVYDDAIGKRASFESVVSLKDMEATKRIAMIAKEAQWFEDHSPIADEHKKKSVKGITAKVITVIQEAGASSPSTPIGINLPNANWIRQQHGSKSVSLGNIVHSYNIVGAKSPMMKEFALTEEEIARNAEFGALASDLHTDMHEVIGHASGQINKGVGDPDQTLKNYASTLEEARADLVALYYVYDPKLVEMGVMPSLEVGKSEYDGYIRNGLITQLTRLQIGENLEEAHMRNRQLNASWAFAKGKADNVIEMVKKDGKTYVKINDYDKLRELFGQLLKEIQRIKSEGDTKAAEALVETYGVKVDQELLKEVKARFEKLNVAAYKGFVQPKLIPVYEGEKLIDVKVEYPNNWIADQLERGKNYSFLPNKN